MRHVISLKNVAIGFGVILLLASTILYYLIYIRVSNSGLIFTNLVEVPLLLEPTVEDGQKGVCPT